MPTVRADDADATSTADTIAAAATCARWRFTHLRQGPVRRSGAGPPVTQARSKDWTGRDARRRPLAGLVTGASGSSRGHFITIQSRFAGGRRLGSASELDTALRAAGGDAGPVVAERRRSARAQGLVCLCGSSSRIRSHQLGRRQPLARSVLGSENGRSWPVKRLVEEGRRSE